MKRLIAPLVVMCALALPSAAQATTRWQGAMAAATNHCLNYTGCRDLLVLQQYVDSHGCLQLYYQFHTTYYGWMYSWTGIYCDPPYHG